jgi:hypothetical protein
MDKQRLEQLELFRMPPELVKKTAVQKKQEQQIQSQYREFYRQTEEDREMLGLTEEEK